MKASPESTVQSYNNDLVILDDIGRKVGSFWASKQIYCKKRISNFFENVKIWCLGLKYHSEMFRNRKREFEIYFQDAGWNIDFEKMKKKLCIFYEGK